MKLIFLIGNIGVQYRGTRHNIAWDSIETKNLEWAEKSRFSAYIAELGAGDDKIIYARPTTYYNEAGRALRAIMDFYKLEPSDVLVVHDDLMLPLGTVRTRIGGSDGGNNGLRSIDQYVDGDTARVRIGIATEQRELIGDTNFVLGKFSESELQKLSEVRATVHTLIDDFTRDNFSVTTHRHSA